MSESYPVPAVCDNCRAVFRSGIAIGGETQAHMTDNKSGPCPRCGGMGSIPNGSYTVINKVLTISPAYVRREDMLRAVGILQDALTQSATPDVATVADRIEAEAPGASWLLTLLRDPAWQGVSGIVGLMALLIAAAALWVSMHPQPAGDDDGGTPTHPHERAEPDEQP